MNILTLICARAGSKGIKHKNIKLFNNKPLIYYSIKQALSSKFINEVNISTDSLKIADISKKYGAKVKFIREKKLGRDNTPEIKVWQDAIKKLERINDINYDCICVLPVTSPLRKKMDIEKCIQVFKKNKCDGVLSISASSKNPYFNMVSIKDNYLKLIKNKKIYQRQMAPKVYDITTVAYVMSANFIKNNNNMFNGKLMYNFVPKERSIDIDDMLDFRIAEFLFKKN
jgi:CMP-N-acetylneuraminic acid synthetase